MEDVYENNVECVKLREQKRRWDDDDVVGSSATVQRY